MSGFPRQHFPHTPNMQAVGYPIPDPREGRRRALRPDVAVFGEVNTSAPETLGRRTSVVLRLAI
jgi:hypothetical protein